MRFLNPAEVLGLPAEQLAAIVEDNRRLAAELAALPPR